MEALVDRTMGDGAFGLSSGLEYEVGSYANTEEVVAVSRVAARHGGFYISHIRDKAARDRNIPARARALRARAEVAVVP
jgi:N-acyl-D-amino-acid deacylase